MAVQYSVELRNAQLDQIETIGGASVRLKLRTGAQPANCAAADTGTVVADITCPVDWLAAAAAGSKAQSGVWSDASADAAGTIAHFRFYKSDNVTCFAQGSVTITGGGGDLTVQNPVVEAGQAITFTGVTFTAANA